MSPSTEMKLTVTMGVRRSACETLCLLLQRQADTSLNLSFWKNPFQYLALALNEQQFHCEKRFLLNDDHTGVHENRGFVGNSGG